MGKEHIFGALFSRGPPLVLRLVGVFCVGNSMVHEGVWPMIAAKFTSCKAVYSAAVAWLSLLGHAVGKA